MANNTNDGSENFWPANQQPPHHYLPAHAQQHQQCQQPPVTLFPVSQHTLPPHLQPAHHPQHPYALPTGPAHGFYLNAGVPNTGPSLGGEGFPPANANNGYAPHVPQHPPIEDEYTVTDAYGQLLKVVYKPQPQVAGGGGGGGVGATGIVRPTEDTNHPFNAPQTKQEYELFSSNNSFMSAAPGFGFIFHHQQQQQQQQQEQQQHQQQQELPPPLASIAQQPPSPVPTARNVVENGTGSSMLINQMVGNLVPTMSGHYLPFGGSAGPSLMTETATLINTAPVKDGNLKASPVKTASTVSKPIVNPVPPTITSTSSTAVSAPPPPPSSSRLSNGNRGSTNPTIAPVPTTSTATAVYNQQNDDNSAKLDQNVNKKQRIVAEVKPMRMSYSDVLSKKVSGATPASNGLPNAASNVVPNGGGHSNATAGAGLQNGTKASTANGSGGHTFSKGGSKAEKREGKKSNGNGGERKAANIAPGNGTKDRSGDALARKAGTNSAGLGLLGPSPGDANKSEGAGSGIASTLKLTQEKPKKNHDHKTMLKKDKGTRNGSGTEGADVSNKKGRNRRIDETNSADGGGEPSNGPGGSDEGATGNDETEEDFDEEDSEEYEQDSVATDQQQQQQKSGPKENGHQQQQQQQQFVYNVKKTVGANDTHIEKIVQPSRGAATTATSSASYRKAGIRNNSAPHRNGPGKQQQQDKALGNLPNGGKRSVRSRKNQKYAFAEKLLQKWLEYMVLVVRWLWSLVSDVVYLSVRLAWDYALAGYQYCWQHACTIRQDFRKNSARPGVWLRGVWKSFDARFDKESRWAFWRHCRRTKATAEPATGRTTHHHNNKDGRLPSTADEAMSSLLNCKGKDAYSILGVSPDCSQEQIRKHYKKIAVLVHPDKNKQPGAEEAFKVLQRSFELIGETETRKEYDQSLAEALNAEKAWSEINDLLTQLHTKISEAANTIRCSSCCLRHPRKPTGRAHYAARECSSCKIRHPAKEGDIWAETSCLGLRWKYLAMMEGNVYDITEWANCQKGALSHLQPNSHVVQYRIVLGSSSGSTQQQQQNVQQDKESLGRSRKEPTVNEPNLDDFLNNIYAGQNQQASSQTASSRRRYRRN
ncbi:uncharacterized protein LOC128271422 [Anopheles cruzii]|uniref:uncharacterized protein LOC128271422 n=1 Tax=Anopheles cruzii TaxID=68878 RepID=UPI0022EC62BC|nr:uncharacterized protein LOC128271422 [Anopheles cruzii]